MMKPMLQALLILTLSLYESVSWGSGCPTTTAYAKGAVLGTEKHEGVFKCGEYQCHFKNTSTPSTIFSTLLYDPATWWKLQSNPPRQGTLVWLQVNTYLAMEWERCDEEDPGPFVPTGILQQLIQDDVEYNHYVPF